MRFMASLGLYEHNPCNQPFIIIIIIIIIIIKYGVY